MLITYQILLFAYIDILGNNISITLVKRLLYIIKCAVWASALGNEVVGAHVDTSDTRSQVEVHPLQLDFFSAVPLVPRWGDIKNNYVVQGMSCNELPRPW